MIKPFMKPARFLPLPLALLLAACASLPPMHAAGGNFRPLSSDIAALAAPEAAAAERPLSCAIDNGTARFKTGWSDYARAEFVLAGAARVDIILRAARGSEKAALIAYFDAPGQKIIFCPYVTDAEASTRIPCASIYALEDDLEMGIKRTFDIPDAVRGSDITCAYSPDALKKL